MKSRSFLETTVIVLLLVVFGGVVFHAPLSVGLGALFPELSLGIKAWKEILMAIAGIILLGELFRRRSAWRALVTDRLLIWASLFILVHFLMIGIFWQGSIAATMGLVIDVRFVVYFLLVYITLTLYPARRRLFLWVGAATAGISLLFALLQVTILPHDILTYIGYGPETITPYLTVDQNYDYVRINGTLRGPNPLGAYAGIILAIATALWATKHALLRQMRVRLISIALIALSLVAIWFSYSRSALGAAGVAVVVILLMTVLRQLPRRIWIGGFVAIGVSVGLLVASWQTPFVQQVLLHNDPSGGSSISSNDEHVESLQTGWERLVDQPFGAGIGSTGSASLEGAAPIIIENQYLFIAHEVGWVGLVLFLILFGIVMTRLWQRRRDYLALGAFASGVGLALIGILLPVWVDDTVSIVWWGLAAVAVCSPPSGVDVSKQKHVRYNQSTVSAKKKRNK